MSNGAWPMFVSYLYLKFNKPEFSDRLKTFRFWGRGRGGRRKKFKMFFEDVSKMEAKHRVAFMLGVEISFIEGLNKESLQRSIHKA